MTLTKKLKVPASSTSLNTAPKLLAAALLGALALLATACKTPVVPQAGPPQTTQLSNTTAPLNTSTTTTIPNGETIDPSTPAMPGLTDQVMRLAVIADVETGGFADNRSRSVWGAISAWATEVQILGGLAGRELEVIHIDTGLFNHQEAINQVCEGDFFAVVGSDALLDNEGIERLGGPDCPVLNFPAIAHSPQHQSHPNTFLSNPLPPNMLQVGPLQLIAAFNPIGAETAALPLVNDLRPVLINGEKLREGATAADFTIVADPELELVSLLCAPHELYQELAEMEAKALLWNTYGAWFSQLIGTRGLTPETDSEATNEPAELESIGGIEAEPSTDEPNGPNQETETTATNAQTEQPDASTATEPDPSPEAANLLCPSAPITSDIPTETSGDEPPATPDPPAELELQFTLCHHTCHSQLTTDLLAEAASQDDFNNPNLLVWTHLRPIEEIETNEQLWRYIILLRLIGDSVDGQPFFPDLQGLAAWSAGQLFQEAVTIADQKLRDQNANRSTGLAPSLAADAAPPAQLTQQAVKEAMSEITEWTSHGLHQPTNPAAQIPSPCFVLLSWNASEASWQRLYPAVLGSWDCDEDNLYTLEVTDQLGLDTES